MRIALHRNKSQELQSVTCHMGLHSVTSHPTQVNAPHLNPSQTDRLVIATYIPSMLPEAVDVTDIKLCGRPLTTSCGVVCSLLSWCSACDNSSVDWVAAALTVAASSRLCSSLSSHFNCSFSCSFSNSTSYTHRHAAKTRNQDQPEWAICPRCNGMRRRNAWHYRMHVNITSISRTPSAS